MEVYRLLPSDMMRGEQFATIDIVEEPHWEVPDEVCERCYEPQHRRRLGPFVVAWEAGSDLIGDFVSLAPSHGMIFTDRVKVALERAKLSGYVAWPVEIREPPKRRQRHRLPMVAYPYTGPKLWDIYVTDYVHIVPEKSTVSFRGLCPECGTPKYWPVGEAEDQEFIIDSRTWNGCDFMRPHEVNAVFVTQRVVDVIREGGFTNFEIMHVGRIGEGTGPLPERRPVEKRPRAKPRPERPKELTELPSLDVEQTARHGEFVKDLVEYLVREGEDVVAEDLVFLRSAQLGEMKYWIWEFYDEVGRHYYALASEGPGGRLRLGYDPAEDSTPEEFIVVARQDWL